MSSMAPSMQPSSRPRNQGVAYTEFLYVSLALILLIVLICLIMCGLKRLCQKKTACDWLCGRSQFIDDQNVEVIIETEAVMDDTHYAECDIETGDLSQSGRHSTPSFNARERGSLKRYGSWIGYGLSRTGSSLIIAQEYQANPRIIVGLAAPMRVMETFQDIHDYNSNRLVESRQAMLSTLPNGTMPATLTTATVLDARDVVTDDILGRIYGGDHDYLIETERNMNEVNDQFLRFAASHSFRRVATSESGVRGDQLRVGASDEILLDDNASRRSSRADLCEMVDRGSSVMRTYSASYRPFESVNVNTNEGGSDAENGLERHEVSDALSSSSNSNGSSAVMTDEGARSYSNSNSCLHPSETLSPEEYNSNFSRSAAVGASVSTT